MKGHEGPLARISRAMARLGGFVLLSSAFLIGGEILVRQALGRSLNVATELSSYALGIAAALAFADTLLNRAHIRVDVAYRLFPPFGRALLDVLSALSLALLGALLAWRGAEVALESLGSRRGRTPPSPRLLSGRRASGPWLSAGSPLWPQWSRSVPPAPSYVVTWRPSHMSQDQPASRRKSRASWLTPARA